MDTGCLPVSARVLPRTGCWGKPAPSARSPSTGYDSADRRGRYVIAGRYTPEREIGRGGMGAVWLARDEVLGRDVAIKRIGMAPGAESADLERAQREARLAARLNHPHVVAVFDLVTDGDARWLVMEYVEGVTLAELVRREGALLPDEAARMLGQVADALAAAHSAGIVHRDVKPSNILVTADGQVKLSDFGIARAEADASLTQTGLVTGSPAYLAPEVASGELATSASDVWSLGATLYHALAGQAPYEVGQNLMGALYRIVHEDPPRFANAGWLGPLLESTMTKQPADRWTMGEVRDFLHAGQSAAGTTPRPVPVPVSGLETDLDPTRTQRFADPLPRPAAPPPAAPTPPTPTSPPRERARRTPSGPVLVALTVALLAGLIVWAVLASGPDDDGTADPGSGDPSSRSSAPTGDATPTADSMETFMEDYLATAPSDPEAGFRMLTPEFQEESGGLDGYTGFWGRVVSADLVSFSADPEALTVTYTVEYVMEDQDQKVSDTVSLALVQAEGTLKIAGEN